MHLAPSTKLRKMILELVKDGSLDFRDEPIPGVAKFRRLTRQMLNHFAARKRNTVSRVGQLRSTVSKVHSLQKLERNDEKGVRQYIVRRER